MESTNYKHWISVDDPRRCRDCYNLQGKIWRMEEPPYPEPPQHPNCRCEIRPMTTIPAGAATENGREGADWTLMYQGELPDYYATEAEAEAKGWKTGKWPCNFVPGKMITMGIYKNMNGHLPEKPGRLWFEADINYQTGKRNDQRVLWSDDGLIFVTYDHYMTFYEIIPAEEESLNEDH